MKNYINMGFFPCMKRLDSSSFSFYSIRIFHSTSHSIIFVRYLFLYMLNSLSFSITTISTPVVFQLLPHIVLSQPK